MDRAERAHRKASDGGPTCDPQRQCLRRRPAPRPDQLAGLWRRYPGARTEAPAGAATGTERDALFLFVLRQGPPRSAADRRPQPPVHLQRVHRPLSVHAGRVARAPSGSLTASKRTAAAYAAGIVLGGPVARARGPKIARQRPSPACRRGGERRRPPGQRVPAIRGGRAVGPPVRASPVHNRLPRSHSARASARPGW